MAKEQLQGWMHEPLAAMFGTRAKVVVLRILWRALVAIPYREVVRRSGMAYGSIALALEDLARTGIVEEQVGGRERRVRLRSSHRLAASIGNLLQADADFFAALRVELRAVAAASQRTGLLSAAIVGAAARREETLVSALEIVLVAPDGPAAVRCRLQFEAAAEWIAERFGVKLRLIDYDLAAARSLWTKRTASAIRNVRDSELLAGLPLEELLAG